MEQKIVDFLAQNPQGVSLEEIGAVTRLTGANLVNTIQKMKTAGKLRRVEQGKGDEKTIVYFPA